MGSTKKYLIQTFGCQMNEHDSEIISGLLQEAGYEPTELREDADIILLNTCCIREKAEHKVLSLLGELKRLIDRKPSLIIGVCGCMVQQKDIVPTILQACPFVRLLVGTNGLHNIARHVSWIEATGEPVIDISDDELVIEAALPTDRKYPFRAYVNITYGCNNFCTYCIVPHVRGRERSRSMDDILREVRALAADGVVEITLLGQNVNSYGNDLPDADANFVRLLQAVDQVPGLERIRFMTSHPKDLSDALIETIAESAHICHQVHLPVQSGSNAVLKRMNRRYSREHYLDLVARIRSRIPDAVLTTDIIVGFPGESEADFQDTVDLAEQVGFDNAFSFVYSPRAGTAAAEFDDQVPLEEKKRRLAVLNQVLSAWSLKRNEPYLEQVVKVLVDGVSRTNEAVLSAKTDGGKIVLFPGPASLVGTLQTVKITEIQTWVLKGQRVE